MAVSTIRVSSRELRDRRDKIVRAALFLKLGIGGDLEGGVDELIDNGETGKRVQRVISNWRTMLRTTGGSMDAVSGELFSEAELSTLLDVEDSLFKLRQRTKPDTVARLGNEVAVKLVERIIFALAWRMRNAANDSLKDPTYGNVRFLESLKDGVPPLKATKVAATGGTIAWFEKLIAELG